MCSQVATIGSTVVECDADRQIYDTLGNMLSTAGYNVLAFDKQGRTTVFSTQRP